MRASGNTTLQLVMAGGVRNDADRLRVTALRLAAVELGLLSRVKFVENAPLAELRRLFGTARYGLHSMWNEHFGNSSCSSFSLLALGD